MEWMGWGGGWGGQRIITVFRHAVEPGSKHVVSDVISVYKDLAGLQRPYILYVYQVFVDLLI